MSKIDSNNLSLEVKSKYSLTNNAFKLDKIKNAELDKYDGNPKDEINVVIGDDKQPDTFIPQVKLQRWTNEVNFSVRLVDKQNGQDTVTTTADKIKWSKGNLDIEFYDFIEGEGGYKMVWYLKKKPKTNKLNFTIQSKGLNFYYQPPLTEEYQNGYSEEFQREIVVTETQVKDLEGNVLVERPENVVGSYAVYHSTKGGMNDVYGKDYKTGQAFFIYRPHIIDAEGKETWGILKIENGIYSVEIPQDFLDKAVYPIKSNDTFGYTTRGGSSKNYSTKSGGTAYINRYGCLVTGASGTLDNIKAYLKSTVSNESSIDTFLAINQQDSEGANSHGQIALIETLNFSVTTSYKLYTFTASSESLSAVNYILNVSSDANDFAVNQAIAIAYNTGGNVYITYIGSTYANAKANPWNQSMSANNELVSIYATYTASSSGPANVKTYKGLAKASVKTCKGLAIASVKSKKGLA